MISRLPADGRPGPDRREINARRRAFVDAAREAFFLHGYAGTPMSSIAAKVGGSKTTLWSYFPSKEALFAAVVDDIVERYVAPILVDLPLEDDVGQTLRRFAEALLSTLLSHPMLDLHQLVIGEASRFPHLAKTFYDRGPSRGKARLAAYFAALMDRGDLRRGDPVAAAYQFVGLCQARRYHLALLGIDGGPAEPGLASEVKAAVGAFLAGWSARGSN